MYPRRYIIAGLLALHAVAAPVRLSGQADAATTAARRIADLVSIAIDEYGVGVVGGRVINEGELREARLFLDEARQSATLLPEGTRRQVLGYFDSIGAGFSALRSDGEIGESLVALRDLLESSLHVTLDVMPGGAPSLARGEALYSKHCMQCHGENGTGDGSMAKTLDPPPADLTDQQTLRVVSPLDFFRKLNVGVSGTAMPGFDGRLGLDDRWALALYASTLRFSQDARDRGAAQLALQCPECNLLISDFSETAALSDDSLAAILDSMTGAVGSTSIQDLVAYARGAGATEELGSDAKLVASRAVAGAKAAVAAAMELGSSGERKAGAARALDGYLVFERIEGAVRSRDAKAARNVERAFTQFRGTLLADGAWVGVVKAREEVDDALDAALTSITPTISSRILFTQSVVIMLREGLEAILIIGALTAFLTKAGADQRKRDIGWGVFAAVVASLVTAGGFATLFRHSAGRQDLLEGITMLVAAGVLFWVSFWLVSKIELRKWQAFVGNQMQRAMNSKRTLALAAVAFLAVYREGFETVLFFSALVTSSDGSSGSAVAVGSGIGVGLIVLGVVYFLMQRYSVRLPLKPFFAATSGLLYVMAFSFAGQGVSELQEIGIISITPLNWVPAIPALGIFPTAQTLFSQLLIATALFGALLWVFWLEPRLVRAD